MNPRRRKRGRKAFFFYYFFFFWSSGLVGKQASAAIRFQVRWWQITIVSDAFSVLFGKDGDRAVLEGHPAVVYDLKYTDSSPLIKGGRPSKAATGRAAFKNNPHFFGGGPSLWSHPTAPALWRVIHPDGMSRLQSVLDKVTCYTWSTLDTRTQRCVTVWPRLAGGETATLPLCCLLAVVSPYVPTGSMTLWRDLGCFWSDQALAEILLLASAGSFMFIPSG